MVEDIPLVTIGLPVYNGEKFLEQALPSLLGQQFSKFQIIISDNASNDRTEEICRKYSAQDSRVHYSRNDINRGPTYNFNRVLGLAKSEYFMWAAYDDLWDPAFLSTLVACLQENPSAVVAFSQASIIDDNNRPIDHVHLTDYPMMFRLSEKDLFRRLKTYIKADDGKSNLVYGLMRTASIQKTRGFVGGFRTPYGSDILLIFRLLCKGEATGTHRVLYFKRATERHEDPSVTARLHRFFVFRMGKLTCFLKYVPLIWETHLSWLQKMSLTVDTVGRIFQWAGKGLIRGFTTIFRK